MCGCERERECGWRARECLCVSERTESVFECDRERVCEGERVCVSV